VQRLVNGVDYVWQAGARLGVPELVAPLDADGLARLAGSRQQAGQPIS
jgi:hypothetical protein